MIPILAGLDSPRSLNPCAPESHPRRFCLNGPRERAEEGIVWTLKRKHILRILPGSVNVRSGLRPLITSVSSLYGWGSWSPEKGSNLWRATQIISGKAKARTGIMWHCRTEEVCLPHRVASDGTHAYTQSWKTNSMIFWLVFIWIHSWFGCAGYKKAKLIKSKWGKKLYFNACVSKFLFVIICVMYYKHHIIYISLEYYLKIIDMGKND